ncbi:unnamed protein product [Owenia fusiformis]|uniref:Uncharacterized protein n=1 Tax=Owenia fusiformis TaxID=6347 RepID=A0A8J1T6P4_OWEFU|nr:unnamed protein product [Owenia fusiformis]
MDSEKEANMTGIERLDTSSVSEETKTLRSLYTGHQSTAPSAPVLMPQHHQFMCFPGYLPLPRVAGMMQFHQGMIPRGTVPQGIGNVPNTMPYDKAEVANAPQMTVMNREAKRTSSFMIDAILGLNRSRDSEVALPNTIHNMEYMQARKSKSSLSQIVRPHPYFHSHYSNQQLRGSMVSKNDCRALPKEIEGLEQCGDLNWGDVKSKRVRTIFTPEQLERLEEEFERQQYMVGTERYYLAISLNLTEAQVKVWFQNRRIKWRKQNFEEQQAKLEQIRHDQETAVNNEVADDIFIADDFDLTDIDHKASAISELITSADINSANVTSLQTCGNTDLP